MGATRTTADAAYWEERAHGAEAEVARLTAELDMADKAADMLLAVLEENECLRSVVEAAEFARAQGWDAHSRNDLCIILDALAATP